MAIVMGTLALIFLMALASLAVGVVGLAGTIAVIAVSIYVSVWVPLFVTVKLLEFYQG